MKGRRGGVDDEDGNEVRHAHAYAVSVRIRANCAGASSGLIPCDLRRTSIRILHLEAGLPEEEVGADRGAEDGDERRCVPGIQGQVRDDSGEQRLRPRHVRRESDADVGEQAEVSHFRTVA